MNLARALLDEGRLDEAAQLAERSAAAAPNPAAYDILGRVRAMKGDVSGARAEFIKALKIDRPTGPLRTASGPQVGNASTPNFQLPTPKRTARTTG